MVKAIYAGSFDPITHGHLDIIKRSMHLCDELTIGIGENPAKKTLFTIDERVAQIKEAVDNHIQVIPFQGLLVQFAQEIGATLLIRGVRSATDFEYEMVLANTNKMLSPQIDTVFLPTTPELSLISSSALKEVARMGGDIIKFTTGSVQEAVKSKFGFIKHGQ